MSCTSVTPLTTRLMHTCPPHEGHEYSKAGMREMERRDAPHPDHGWPLVHAPPWRPTCLWANGCRAAIQSCLARPTVQHHRRVSGRHPATHQVDGRTCLSPLQTVDAWLSRKHVVLPTLSDESEIPCPRRRCPHPRRSSSKPLSRSCAPSSNAPKRRRTAGRRERV